MTLWTDWSHWSLGIAIAVPPGVYSVSVAMQMWRDRRLAIKKAQGLLDYAHGLVTSPVDEPYRFRALIGDLGAWVPSLEGSGDRRLATELRFVAEALDDLHRDTKALHRFSAGQPSESNEGRSGLNRPSQDND